MATAWKRGKKNTGPKIKERRNRALVNLEAKLKKGLKEIKGEEIPLNDIDKSRIQKEITTLKERI